MSFKQELNIEEDATLKMEEVCSIKKEIEIKTENELILTDGIVYFTSNEDDWENINGHIYSPLKDETTSTMSTTPTNPLQIDGFCDKERENIMKESPSVDYPFHGDPPPIPDEKLATVMKFLDRKSKSHPTGKSAREAMIAFHKTGMPASEIAKYFSVNAATVRRWIKRHKTQNSVSDLPRSGRKVVEIDKGKG